MSGRPNVLVLMADQMQGRVLDPESPCRTPRLDALAARGARVRRGYTPNPVCSPARASLMTGLLPHNHGVEHVIHCVAPDQGALREDKVHWAQRLWDAGYATAYFGKWHVERSGNLAKFGWDVDGTPESERYREVEERARKGGEEEWKIRRMLADPPGYPEALLYGVTTRPAEERAMGVTVTAAIEFIEGALKSPDPWCCFVSVPEPHDPFVAGIAEFGKYRPSDLPVPRNWSDDLAGRPNLYRKAARVFRDLTGEEKRLAAACYYASITEIDSQFGRIIDLLASAGRLENTVVAVTSDHGELLGAHGLYMKNVSAFEEVYHVPMLLSGPGIAEGAAPDARVGLHDLAPTLLELAGLDPIGAPDSRSFAPLLRDPAAAAGFQTGYAEYFGTRYHLTQRVIWDGKWKLVFNGFDFDELYDLESDPDEMDNLAGKAAHADDLKGMFARAWRTMEETGDAQLAKSRYPALRLAPFGPGTSLEKG